MSILAMFACNDDPENNPDGFTEFVANIDGNWKIEQVLQNGKDITDLLDFQSFSLQLTYGDGQPSSYTFSNLMTPFGLSEANGSWSFDDLVYPTRINFSDGTSLAIEGPVLSGGNELKVTVPLGCTANTYVYHLSK
jgi:hypothetical protein